MYAALPLGEGRVLDPFMGGGSTLAAADTVGYNSVGVEIDKIYYDLALSGVPLLAALYPTQEIVTQEQAPLFPELTEHTTQTILF